MTTTEGGTGGEKLEATYAGLLHHALSRFPPMDEADFERV